MFDLAALERADRAMARLSGKPERLSSEDGPRVSRDQPMPSINPEDMMRCPHLRGLSEARA